MKVSKETIQPVPPPPLPSEYRLVLTEEEFFVLKAALAVAKFPEVREKLDRFSPIRNIDSDSVLYKMHTTLYDFT